MSAALGAAPAPPPSILPGLLPLGASGSDLPTPRKLPEGWHRVDKGALSKRRAWCQRCVRRFKKCPKGIFAVCYTQSSHKLCNWCKRGHHPCKDVCILLRFACGSPR